MSIRIFGNSYNLRMTLEFEPKKEYSVVTLNLKGTARKSFGI